MKNDLTCGVVRDLLPSYVEGLLGAESQEAVERHLEGCPDCAARWDAMTAPTGEPQKSVEELDFLKQVKRENHRRVIVSVLATFVGLLAAALLKTFVIGTPMQASSVYCDALEEDGVLHLSVMSIGSSDALHGWKVEIEDGVACVYARRVLVSTALIGDAKLIVADEPTPGLSKTMAKEAMGHFRSLADEGRAVILITHDIDLAFEYADAVAVFYAGTTVETASAEDFRKGPDALRHPYSKALWTALPQNGFQPIPGTQPYAGSLPKGCLFAPRCSKKTKECTDQEVIPMRTLRGGEVCCIHAD